MNLSALFLVTFDFTNTLLEHRRGVGLELKKITHEYGIFCRPDYLEQTYQKVWKNMTKLYPNFGKNHKRFKDWKHFLHSVIFDVIFELSPESESWDIDIICERTIHRYLSPPFWKRTPGMRPMLSYLLGRQVRTGVITNFDPRVRSILYNMRMEFFFKFILNSYEVGHRKPAKEIFREAEKMAQREGIKPKNCLHIGDSVEEDYWGARRAGWNAFLIHRNKPYDEKGVDKDYVFQDLRAALKRLRQKDVIFEPIVLQDTSNHTTPVWRMPTTSTFSWLKDYNYDYDATPGKPRPPDFD